MTSQTKFHNLRNWLSVAINLLFSAQFPDYWTNQSPHDDVIKWKHCPRYWPFVRGIHRSPVNSPHKGQWHGSLMFSLICVGINGWVNNLEAGDLRRYRAHYDVIVMAPNHSHRLVIIHVVCVLHLYQTVSNTSVRWTPAETFGALLAKLLSGCDSAICLTKCNAMHSKILWNIEKDFQNRLNAFCF